ncbi:MAG TPA: heme-binding protein [Methylibium sp.]|nr:heme-binding protein [Methylibium sp.]
MNQATVPLRQLTSEAAQAAVEAAIAHAEKLGVRVVVAAVDAGGVLLALRRMDGAFLHSIDIAIDKAYTAVSFGFPTEGWAGVLADNEMRKVGLSVRPRLVVLGGGVPACEGALRVGAIGVSGATAEQDAECARAGLEAIGLQDAVR